jgi:hypothetical protein
MLSTIALGSLQADQKQGALRTFIDNVAVLVLENCLMYNLHELFSIQKVRDMARNRPDLLSYLASEPEHIQQKRALLRQKEKRLDEACKLCQRNLSSSYFRSSTTPTHLNVRVTPPTSRPSSSLGFGVQSRSNVTTPIHQRSSSFTSPSTRSESTPLTIPSQRNTPISGHKKVDSGTDVKQPLGPLNYAAPSPSNAGIFDIGRSPSPMPSPGKKVRQMFMDSKVVPATDEQARVSG